jgi:hypothetical protein
MNDDRNLRNNPRTPDAIDADLDRGLHARFAALRHEEEQQVPEFASFWRRVPRSSRSRARWLVAAACVVIVLAGILWQRAIRAPQDLSVASITEWKAPTDFLLETPGREWLRTVPAIGVWPGYAATASPVRPAEAGKKTSY